MKRPRWSRKGDFGRVLIIGGSREYSGAPGLAGLAALTAGCDIATIAAPEKVAWAINSYSPDLITYKLPGEYLSLKHVPELLKLSEKFDSILIGNGLGDRKETLEAVQKLVEKIDKLTVLDADALKIKRIPAGAILTPHATEFYRLFGMRPPLALEPRKKMLLMAAKKSKCIILLKGHIDLISDGTRIVENKTGNPHMTVGGTGDTLAGILVSLLAQKIPPFKAAVQSAKVNGKAGDICLKKEHRVLASNLIKYIPRA